MRFLTVIFASIWMAFGFAAHADDTVEAVVARAIEAHNAHDIDGFLATLAEDVSFHNLDGDTLLEGRETVREIWSARFASNPDLIAEITHRTVVGNRVVDEERLCMSGLDAPCIDLVAIYTVEDGLIQTMHVIQAEPASSDDGEVAQ